MLKTPVWCNSKCFNWPTPLELLEVKHEQVIEPELTITTTKDKHLVVDDARSVELTHWSFSSDDAWNVKDKLVDTLLEINKDNVGENLEPIPSTINDDLAAIPDLTRVPHSWLRKLLFVNFWLGPVLLLYITRKYYYDSNDAVMINLVKRYV